MIKKHIIPAAFTLLFLVMINHSYAQTSKLFRGTINNGIKITLYMQGLDEGTNADAILGAYKYDNQGKYSLLNGYRNNDGNVVLVEQSTPNFSGTFLGTLTNKQIKGKWISANLSKTYPFLLTEIVATKEQLAKFKKAITDKASEFRSY